MGHRRPRLAIREVFAAGAVDPDGFFLIDIDTKVCAVVPVAGGGFEMDLVFGLEVVADELLSFVDFFPCGDGVGEVQEPGFEDELFVLGKRHLGILGGGEGRVERAAPSELTLGGSLQEPGHQWFIGNPLHRNLCRINPRECLCIGLCPEPDADIDRLDNMRLDWIQERELFVRCIFVENILNGSPTSLPERMSTGLENRTKYGLNQWHRHRIAIDRDQIALFYLCRVFHNHISQFVETGILHILLQSGMESGYCLFSYRQTNTRRGHSRTVETELYAVSRRE